MDYGKLAYMKAEELESRLVTQTKNPYQSTSAFIAPDCPVPNEGIELAEFVSDGTATLIMRIEVAGVGAEGARLDIKTNEGICAATKIFYSDGADLIMGSVKAKTGTLTAHLSKGAVLKSVNLAFMGGGAYLSKKGDDYRAVKTLSGEKILFTRDSRIFEAVKTDSSAHGEFEVAREMGIGQKIDACSVKDGYCAAYCDFYGNIWGLNQTEGVENRFLALNRAIKSLAIANTGSGLLLAVVNLDKTVSIFLSDYNFKSRMEIPCDFTADRISFLSCLSPVMVVEKDGEAELRFFESDGAPATETEIGTKFEYSIL